MEKTTVYLTEELQHALRRESRRTGEAQAELIRDALTAFFLERPAGAPRSIGLGEDAEVSARTSEDWLRKTWSQDS